METETEKVGGEGVQHPPHPLVVYYHSTPPCDAMSVWRELTEVRWGMPSQELGLQV